MNSSKIWWGSILIIFGVLFLLDNMHVIDVGSILEMYWPVALIILGASVLLGQRNTSKTYRPSIPDGTPMGISPSQDTNQLVSSNVFGDFRVNVHSKSFAGGAVSTVFGDTNIDLSDATLKEGEHVLKLDGVFGDTTVRLPKDMSVSVSVGTTFGDLEVMGQRKEGMGQNLTFKSPDFSTSTARLRIKVSLVFGDISVSAP